MAYRVFHRRFESCHHPDNRKGEMATRERAATWDDRAEAEAVAAELTNGTGNPNTGSSATTTGSSSTDREPQRVI
jgi:hypothetical protein